MERRISASDNHRDCGSNTANAHGPPDTGASTQADVNVLYRIVAKQFLSPSLPPHVGTMFQIHVLDFDGGDPLLTFSLLPELTKLSVLLVLRTVLIQRSGGDPCRGFLRRFEHCVKHR